MNKTIVFNGPGSNSLYIPPPAVTKEVHPKKEVVVFDDPGLSYKSDGKCCIKNCNNTSDNLDGETLITILEKLKESLIVTEDMLSDQLKLKIQDLIDSISQESERAQNKESEIEESLNSYYTKEVLDLLLDQNYYTKEQVNQLLEEYSKVQFQLISEEDYEETKQDLDTNVLYIIDSITN